MHFSKLTRRSRLAGAAAVLAVVAAGVVATADPAFAAVPLTITPANGPAGSTTGPTVTVNTTTSVFSGTPIVEFQILGTTALPTTQAAAQPTAAMAACWPSYVTPITPTATPALIGTVAAATVVKYSATRLYVTVP